MHSRGLRADTARKTSPHALEELDNKPRNTRRLTPNNAPQEFQTFMPTTSPQATKDVQVRVLKFNLWSLRFIFVLSPLVFFATYVKVWSHVYGRDNLNVAPEDHAVLLTEAPLNPYKNRRQCAEIFFENFGVPAMFCAPQVTHQEEKSVIVRCFCCLGFDGGPPRWRRCIFRRGWCPCCLNVGCLNVSSVSLLRRWWLCS